MTRIHHRLIHFFILFASLAGYFYFWHFEIPHSLPSAFSVTANATNTTIQTSDIQEAPIYLEASVSDGSTREVHSVTAYYSYSDHRLYAYWYGGTREGAGDVAIYASSYAGNQWLPSRKLIDPGVVEKDTLRFTRKVGNPVAYQWPDGEVWLLFVSVSVGGWGGSSINLIRSRDGGLTWSKTQKLVTSPFLNISTLVRGSVIAYQDGTIGVPVYHESIGKFGELIRMDQSGRILDKTRLSSGTQSLQPVISPLLPDSAVGFLRYAGEAPERVLRIETENRGTTWTRPEKLELPNPNSAVDSLALNDTDLLLVFNDTPEGRVDLALGYSDDMGKNWKRIHYLEFSGASWTSHNYQYAYPAILMSGDGRYHIFYTYNRSYIKHVTFNESWLQARIAGKK